MYKYLVVLTTLLIGATTAPAATWNGFQKASNEQFTTFFDAETVIKKNDTVTVWVKSVNDTNHPNSDGSYAKALKMEYSCKKRKFRTLSASTYDKKHQFIQSFGADAEASDIAPGTVGEDILTAVCTPDFPKNKAEKYYYIVKGNDIFQDAAGYFDKLTDLAPTTTGTWAGFSHASNNKTTYFFDMNTVIKNGDIVTIWAKYVQNEKYPEADGSYSAAEKYEFSCSNNTIRTLRSSVYDKEGKFMKAYTKVGGVEEIKPNTLSHGILTAICTPDFPNNTSREQYYPVGGNDIYGDAAAYFKTQEEKLTDSAPK